MEVFAIVALGLMVFGLFLGVFKNSFKSGVTSFLAGILSLVVYLGAYTIESGTVGVISTLGKYSTEEVLPGFHIKTPFIQSVRDVDVRQNVEQENITTLDSNNLPIGVHVSFKWRVLEGQASEMLVKYNDDMFNRLIRPSVRNVVRNIVGQYSGEDIAKSRQKLAADIEESLEEVFAAYDDKYFNFSGIDVRDITLDSVVMTKIKAVQLAKQREKELENEVLQKKQEANKRKIDADTLYYEKVKLAEGVAQKILKEAEATAEANTKIAASLSRDLIEYTQVQQWNGTVPRISAGAGGMGLFVPSEFAK